MKGTTARSAAIAFATLSAWSTPALLSSPQEGGVPVARRSFDVASVRPSPPGPGAFTAVRFRVQPGGRFVANGATLVELIRYAFDLESYQLLEGGRSNLLRERFDINAVSSTTREDSAALPADSGAMKLMLQNLLAQRFALRVRWEEPEQPVLLLVRAHSDGHLGPGLRSSTLDCANPDARKAQPSGLDCAIKRIDGQLTAAGHRMAAFATYLSRLLGRPVFVRTNLEGAFSIDMTSNSDAIPPVAQSLIPFRSDPSPSNGPALATAMEEQLGLALKPGRERVRMLVIDHVEPPTPN